jgi:xylulokinase
VSFGLKDLITLIKEAGLSEIHQVRASGGGMKRPLWRQILADVLEVELVTVDTTEGAAYGAALLAAVGAGTWADVSSACKATITVTGNIVPHPQFLQTYGERYTLYRQLYPALKPVFEKT